MVMPKTVFLVFSEPIDGDDEAFNDWYDNVHLPELLAQTPGFVSARRYTVADGNLPEAIPGYLAIYEIDGDIAAAQAALEAGRPTRTPTGTMADRRVKAWCLALPEPASAAAGDEVDRGGVASAAGD